MTAVTPPARNAALAAAAAPVAPYGGISTRSSATPTTSDASGPSDDNPGEDDAIRPLEKTAVAAKPIAPGRSQRNGSTEGRKAFPKSSGSSTGPRIPAARTA